MSNSEGKALPVKGTERTKVPDDNDVVVNGVIVGSDPDPKIRAEIRRTNGDESGGA